MKSVLVVTQNPAKYEGAVEAFKEYYDDEHYQIEMPRISVSSDVSEQPIALQAMTAGVENRINNARALSKQLGKFALYVAVESGCYSIKGRWFEATCAGVYNGRELAMGMSQHFELPDNFIRLLKKKKTLEQAMKANTDIDKAGSHIGFSGWLAGEQYDRKSITRQAVYGALCKLGVKDLQ